MPISKTPCKALLPDGGCEYFPSLAECCEAYNIRYTELLKGYIEQGQLAPDGKTFFDYLTDEEMEVYEQDGFSGLERILLDELDT